MPIVPRSPGQQVATRALPGPRVSVNAPSAAFGVPTGIDTSGVQRVVQDIANTERQKADQVAVLDATNQLDKLHTDLAVSATSRLGKDAMGALSDVQSGWRKGTTEIETGLKTDRQRAAFAEMKAHRWGALYSTVEQHSHAESLKYDRAESASFLENRRNEAVENPANAEKAIKEGVASIADFAWRNGMDPETKSRLSTDFTSHVHAAVVGRMLAAGDDRSASAYYKAHKAEVVGDTKIELEKSLEQGSTLGEGQRQADDILGKTTTLSEAKKLAKAIDDPKVREEAEQRIRRDYADRDADERQQRAAAYQGAYAILERTGDYHRIPLSVREKLTPDENGALQRREDQMRHPKRETDISLYSTLMNMAGLNPATRSDFEQINLAQYYTQLDEDDFKSLVSLQLQMRKETARGDTKAADEGVDTPDRTLPPDVRLQIPQAWADSAATNPAYLKYLRHMRVGMPGVKGGTGDIALPADTTRGTP